MSTLPEHPDSPLAGTEAVDLASLLLPADYVTLRMALVDEVGFDAAVLLERVRWKCEIRPEGWVATYDEIGAETRLSRRKVHAAVMLLRERGWLVSENAGNQSRTLCWRVVMTPSSRNVTMGGIVPKRDDHSAESGLCTSYREPRKQIPSPPDGGGLFDGPEPLKPAPVDALFEEWYSRYPRKVGKGAARKAYAAALRKVSAPQVLLDGLAAALPDLTSREASYRPHPASWLNAERWDDEQPSTELPPPRTDPFGDPNAPLPPVRTDPFA